MVAKCVIFGNSVSDRFVGGGCKSVLADASGVSVASVSGMFGSAMLIFVKVSSSRTNTPISTADFRHFVLPNTRRNRMASTICLAMSTGA